MGGFTTPMWWIKHPNQLLSGYINSRVPAGESHSWWDYSDFLDLSDACRKSLSWVTGKPDSPGREAGGEVKNRIELIALFKAVFTAHTGANTGKQQPCSQEAWGETCSPQFSFWYCCKVWCSREFTPTRARPRMTFKFKGMPSVFLLNNFKRQIIE